MSEPREGKSTEDSVPRSRRFWSGFRREAGFALVLLTIILLVGPLIPTRWFAIVFGTWLALGVFWSGGLLIDVIRTPLPKADTADTAPESHGRIARIKPHLTPGWRAGVLTAVLLGLSCWTISAPGGYFEWIFACWGLWLLLGLIWFVRLTIALAVARRETRWRNWLVQPAFAVALIALTITNAPLWTSYLASRGAMNDQARAVLAGKDPRTIHRIGLYRVESAEKTGDGFRFLIDGAGFIDSVGFAYSENGPPSSIDDSTYEHWDGPWYIWTQRF